MAKAVDKFTLVMIFQVVTKPIQGKYFRLLK